MINYRFSQFVANLMSEASVNDCSSDVQIKVKYTTDTTTSISSLLSYFNEDDVIATSALRAWLRAQ